MADTTLLHMANAGAGEAMILEYGPAAQRKFIIVDGGPANWDGSLYQDIAYFKYFFSAAKKIWGDGGRTEPFNPSAIISSCLNEDHYRGLVSYLKSASSKNGSFRGPIVVLSTQSLGLAEFKAVLGKGQLKWTSQPGFPSDALSGLICDAPDSESIKTYKASASDNNQGGAITQLPANDAKYEVLNSEGGILMHTDPGSPRKGHIFFTGDDAGWKIGPSVAEKQYSIYKIQDHGRWQNGRLAKETRIVSDGVKRETALRSLFAANIRGYVGFQDSSLLKTRARVLFNHICSAEQLTAESAAAYLTSLDTRHQAYLTACASNLDDGNGNFAIELIETHGGTALTPVPSEVMLRAEGWVHSLQPSEPEFPLFYSMQESKVAPAEEWIKWISSDSWSSRYLSILSIHSICDFFQSFSANAYAVSGNWKGRHELAATIVGLGLAMHNKKRTAILYLTDPSALAVSVIAFYCSVLGKDITTFFTPTSLSIRFLSQGFYLTLNGDESPPANGRDVNQRSAELRLGTSNMVTDAEVKTQLESDASKLADRFKASDGGYQVSSMNVGTTSYLCLTAPNKPGIQTSKPLPLAVIESWSSAADALDSVQCIQATATGTLNGSVMKLGKPSGANSWPLTWVNQANGDKRTFYVNNTTGVVTEGSVQTPPATGSSVALFKFETMAASKVARAPLLSLPPHTDDRLAISPSLRKFCEAAGIEVSASFSGTDALAALVGKDHLTSLGFTLNMEEAALSFAVNLDSSTVDFVDSGVSFTVHAARIHFVLSDSSTISFGSTKLRVISQVIELTWDTNLALSTTLYVNFKGGMSIKDPKSVENATRTTPLRKCLLGMGMSADALATIKIPKLLSFLSDRPASVIEMLEEQLPAVLVKSGIGALKPDLKNSVVQASHTPTKQAYISNAKIACDLGSAPSWNKKITLMGKELTIKDMKVVIENAATSAQRISFVGSASTQAISGLDITMKWSSVLDSNHVREWFFTLNNMSIAALSQLLPDTADLPQLTIPIAESPLSSLVPSVVGFSLRQPVASVSDYHLANLSIAVTIAESSWKKMLPSSFPVQKIGPPTIRVNVHNPGSKNLRQVGVDVEVTLRSAIALQIQFGAEPLVGNQHEFRMRVTGPPEGVSLAQIASEIGLGNDLSTKISSAIPIVGDFLSRAHVVVLCPTLTLQGSTATFGDWRLILTLETWPITDAIVLHRTHLTLESISGMISAKGTASLLVGNKEVDVAAKTPQANLPGEVRVTAPKGISAADLLRTLRLPDLSDIPEVGSLLSVQLDSASCTVDYTKTEPRKLVCVGASLTCSGERVSIGPLVLVGVKATFQYHGQDDPLGPGKAQKTFHLSATLEDNSFQVDASYDDAKPGSIQLRFTRKSKVTLNQTLTKLLPNDITNVIAPVVGTLAVDHVEVSFDPKTKRFTSFEVALSDLEPLAVDKVTLTSLRVVYKAAVVAKGNDKGSPTSLKVNGSVKKEAIGATFEISCLPSSKVPSEVDFSILPTKPDSLSLANFITLLGVDRPAWASPSGSPDFFTFQVTKISGQIAKPASSEQRKSLVISKFEAVVETSAKLTVLQNLNIQLDQLRLDLKYEKGKGLSAQFNGRLSLKSPTVNVWVRYTDEPVKQYEGELSNIEGPYDAKELANRFLSEDQFKMPENVEFPATLPLVSLHVLIKPGVSAKVWGMGQKKWNPTLSGVPIEMASLGASVEVREPKEEKQPTDKEGDMERIDVKDDGNGDGKGDGKAGRKDDKLPTKVAKDYDIRIIGKLGFTDFTAATALLDIRTNHGLILQASVKKKQNAKNELEGLTNELASTDKARFAQLSKNSTIPSLSIADKELQLYLDFDKKLFYLAGTIGDNISALILGRPKLGPAPQESDARNYVVSVVVQDIGKLWPEFDSTVGQVFDCEVLAGEIVAYDGTYAQLTDDLKTAYSQLKIKGSNDASNAIVSQDGKVGLGVLFFGKLSLKGTKAMTDAVNMIVEKDKPAEIIVSAMVTKPAANSQFLVSISNLTFWGGHLVLNDTRGMYSNKKFSVAGKLTATFEGLDKLKFDINLDVEPGSTRFKAITAVGDDTKPVKPFGKFHFQMKKFSIEGKFLRKDGKRKSEVTITGDATLGGKVGLTGALMFVDGAPCIAGVNFKGLEIDIKDVVQLFNGSSSGDSTAVAWPNEYQALALKLNDLYYAKSDQTIDGRQYTTGFHISALCKLFSDEYKFSLDAAFAAPGLKIEAKYLPSIDLDFASFRDTSISIEATKSKVIKFASLTLRMANDQKKSYTGKTTVTVLDLNPTSVDLSYASSDHSYLGTFQYKGTILGLSNPTIKIKYSKEKKFQVLELPIPAELGEALKLVEGIEEASKTIDTNKCGALVKMILKIQKTKFSLNVALGGTKPSVKGEKKIQFYITGKFEIFVADKIVATIQMPKLHGALEDFKATSLQDAIKELLKNNAKALGEQILQDWEQFLKLFGTIALADISEKLLSVAMCRKIKTDNVKDKARQTAESKKTDVKSKGSETKVKLTEAGGAAGAAGAAGAMGGLAGALGAAGGLLEGFGAALAGFAGFLVGLFSFFGIGSSEEQKYSKDKKDLEGLHTELKNMHSAAIEFIHKDVLKMDGSPTCTFVTGERLHVDWSAIKPNKAGFDYENFQRFTWTVIVSFSGNIEDKNNFVVSVPTTMSKDIDKPEFLYAPTVYVWVKATYKHSSDPKQDLVSLPSRRGSKSHVPSLKPPGVSFSSASGQCTVTVKPLESEKYRIVIAGADEQTPGSTLYNPEPHTLDQNALDIPWAKLQVPETLPTSVRAYVQRLAGNPNSHNDSPWAKSPQEVRLAPVPKNMNPKMSNASENTDVDVQWQQPGEATTPVDYELQVFRVDDDKPISSIQQTPQTVGPDQRKVRLSSSEFTPGLRIAIKVRVVQNDNAIALTVTKPFQIVMTPKQPPFCDFLPLGALIQRFRVGDQNIVLGYDSQDDYVQYKGPQFGRTIGRVGNRIENGTFQLNEVDYHLPQTDGYGNTTDGGKRGWGKRIFQGPIKEKRNGVDATLFTYLSADGEEGFPGEVEIKVWYMESHGSTATGKPTTVLTIEYEAATTREEVQSTIVNVTNRSYFNLTDEPSIEGTKVKLCTRKYLPVDKRGIPTGGVSDFSTDFTQEAPLGADEPKVDHCFVAESNGNWTIDTRGNPPKTLGSFSKGNVHLEVQSTEPAFQFNTGDHLNLSENPRYGPRSGFYIEPCRYINAINKSEWQNMVILKPGEKYGYKNVYTAWKE
ncbi:aldose epimerase family protein [Aspergillus melleus]|uniref:aldose epimerase family protein n=1 Tax=Aspergillus melleus TaxID=138277 RepID=UPI001E8D6431|nr:uncharacterized protein LDX57_008764 [Aspergillus melleus]KAH8431103.1 hypothetical protein LDX57_008764 [Aspergillus melleus]